MKRVVITGIGIYSCIGKDVQTVVKNLYEGNSGIDIDINRVQYGYRSPLAGIVDTPNLKGELERRLRVTLSEEAEYAYIASKQAFEDAEINIDSPKTDIGILYGNDSSAKATIHTHLSIAEKGNTSHLGSGAVFQSMNSSVTMNLATIFKLKGINMTISGACASGSHAIGLATMYIRQGLQKIILCGGAQETNHYALASFDALGAFSLRVSEPKKASRPFDANRDGLIPSGGAASLILEEYEHAVNRGAKIYGEVIGYGFSSNGGNIVQPCSIGCERAIKQALIDANLSFHDISYINAHATSTQQGDAAEADALNNIFNNAQTPISSTKSITGHECWMAGASEIVYSLLMMRYSFIAPNINFEIPDEHSKKLNIIKTSTEYNITSFLSNSFGFGGTNNALIIKKI